MNEVLGIEQRHPAKYWHRLADGRIQCEVCPHDCRLHEGQRGLCSVRRRIDDQLVLTTYGHSSGFCVDPIEKKPLNHFFPGSSVFSFGTAGANLACKHFKNGDIARSRQMDKPMDAASPEEIARTARAQGCKSVAFNYNDPVVFLEYALDTADACHERGLKTVAVTAGYIHEAPRREFFARMDAANIDLKAFTEDFYVKLTGGHLQPVLDTLAYVQHETSCWLEITTLLIPGYNDSAREISELAGWVAKELGPGVPLHFSGFHPEWKLPEVPPTSPATLTDARRIALDAGLLYVYTGHVHDTAGDTTYCPACRQALIVRDRYEICHYDLTAQGGCPKCGTLIAGHFGQPRIPYKPSVSRPIPVLIQTPPGYSA